ncbi:sporulation protein [Marinomonas primoryensis]|jgi:cell division protein FtsN|uniref:SPOR domain-containing protein n=1 Tax=Marinomonas primoryensis TaxID=178399 RepID=A0A2Z4PMX2_9GAMM|nr:SPOR domain-containing protein [Marinomonas primoryensis]AWX98796.1 sporulation protein [Marinomonas primoryensis]QKK82254.1 sporulation related domain-containing protein [Marinomonas primoryensis]|tara:strand:- start:76 stop:693 length:618 start_codon:yes stop_codon:yes gene_type:complete
MFNPMQIAAKGSRPRKGATRRSPPPPKRKTAWWLWLLVPAILVAFIYGLMQLNQVAPTPKSKPVEKIKAIVKPLPKEIKITPKEVKIKPVPKKDTFEFYQILQDSEVDTSHVDAYQSTPRGEQDFYYMLQAASFRSPEDADRMRARLIISGLVEANVRKTIGKGEQPWYRVTLGPYESRSKMNRAEDKLVSMEISPYSYKVKKEQ